jgi:small subunit ribosomal protein S9
MTAGIFDKKSLRGRTKRAMVAIGKELNKIHPVLMPPELKKWLNKFAPLKYDGSAGSRQKRMLDKFQRSRGNGKRKTARAKVQVLPGEGNVYVNGKLAADFFKRTKDVENVIWPLKSLNVLGQYNVWVSTWGGGTTGMFLCRVVLMTGQSEACKLAVARAMLAHDDTGTVNMYRRVLRKGMLF